MNSKRQVREDHHQLKEEVREVDRDGWATTCTLRCSAMFRHYAQSALRCRKWVPEARGLKSTENDFSLVSVIPRHTGMRRRRRHPHRKPRWCNPDERLGSKRIPLMPTRSHRHPSSQPQASLQGKIPMMRLMMIARTYPAPAVAPTAAQAAAAAATAPVARATSLSYASRQSRLQKGQQAKHSRRLKSRTKNGRSKLY